MTALSFESTPPRSHIGSTSSSLVRIATSPKQTEGIAKTVDGLNGMPRSEPLALLVDREASIEMLNKWATEKPDPSSLKGWVQEVFVQPQRRRPPTNMLKTDFREGAIGYWEIRRAAMLWDQIGPATPAEFVEAISCETTGHERAANIFQASRELGAVSNEDDALDSEQPDEWTEWRYANG